MWGGVGFGLVPNVIAGVGWVLLRLFAKLGEAGNEVRCTKGAREGRSPFVVRGREAWFSFLYGKGRCLRLGRDRFGLFLRRGLRLGWVRLGRRKCFSVAERGRGIFGWTGRIQYWYGSSKLVAESCLFYLPAGMLYL